MYGMRKRGKDGRKNGGEGGREGVRKGGEGWREGGREGGGGREGRMDGGRV